MSKQLGIILGLILLLIAAAFAYTQLTKSSSNKPATQQTNTGQEETQASQTKGSIQSLLGVGKNVTCTITYPDNQGTGTIYVANDKMRGDFQTAGADGATIDSHMIRDGEFAYIWSDTVAKAGDKKQGTKINISEAEKMVKANSGQTQAADLNKEVDMDCSTWTVSNTSFALPTDVTFTDLTETLKQIQTPSGTMDDSKQSPCDQIPDAEAKASCIKALSGS